MLLGYLAFKAGDATRLKEYAGEAIKRDPNYPNAHWLMAEAHLLEGEADLAAREAETALDLNPSSREAARALKKARGKVYDLSVEQLIERAVKLSNKGKTDKARRRLLRALRRSEAPCPDCHRALAIVYEKAGSYQQAISEWQTFAREAPGRAAAEQVPQKIESLRQKTDVIR